MLSAKRIKDSYLAQIRCRNPRYNGWHGPILFQLASTAVQDGKSGYDSIRDAISSLVFGPFGWVQTSVFFIFALSLIALTALLFLAVRVKFNAGAFILASIGPNCAFSHRMA